MNQSASSPNVAIWNPASGSAPDRDDLQSALGDGFKLVPTTEDDPGPGQARDAVAVGAGIVVACGGDGTVRACLDPLAGSDTALALVPLGTGNLLASNLDIPSGLDAAAGVGRGQRRRIDIGRMNGEAFAVMAGTGFDAFMIRDANDRVKSVLGTPAYVLSALKHLRTGVVGTRVVVDGKEWFSGHTSMVLIGNFGEVSAGIEIFPDAEPDDGRLDVAVMSASSLREWASVALALLRGTQRSMSLIRRTQGSTVEIHQSRPRAWELDGEDRDPATELSVSVEPLAVTIHHAGDAGEGDSPY